MGLEFRDFQPLKLAKVLDQAELWLGINWSEHQLSGAGFQESKGAALPEAMLVAGFLRDHDLAFF